VKKKVKASTSFALLLLHGCLTKLGSSSNKWLNKDFWLRQSHSLFWTGKAQELSSLRASRAISFFESGEYVSLPSYGK
jgi:hypothetical protein